MLLIKTLLKCLAFSFICSIAGIAVPESWQAAIVGLIWFGGLIWLVADAVGKREAKLDQRSVHVD